MVGSLLNSTFGFLKKTLVLVRRLVFYIRHFAKPKNVSYDFKKTTVIV